MRARVAHVRHNVPVVPVSRAVSLFQSVYGLLPHLRGVVEREREALDPVKVTMKWAETVARN